MAIEIIVTATLVERPLRPFSEILVPLDPESTDVRALVASRNLALATGAHITLVAVADPDEPVPEEWHSTLHHLVASLGPAVVSAVIARSRTVADGVVEATDDLARAVVCMTTEAPGRLRDSFDLTSSSAVVHHVHCPVLLVGPAAAALPEPIAEMVAFVETSAEWAAAVGARLWIVEVLDPDLSVGGDAHDSNYVARLAANHRREGLDIEWEVLRAKDPAKEIARFLRDEHPGALAALGSHGRSGWAELRLGSTCMRVAHDAVSPTLVIPAPH